MQALRTPEARFEGLPGYPFAPHYHTLASGLRMHYVDEGPRDAPAVLMLHGEPSWSYLYRKMIPVVAAAGLRAIAPDLIGFGKSDKPAKISDYSYAGHVAWLREWIEALDLKGLTLFCQDWGSLLGLRLAMEHPERFERIVVANGFLPTGERGANRAFMIWRTFAKYSPWFPIGRIVANGCGTKLTPEEIAAYDAPYPSAKYKAGARAFPPLVPISTSDPAAAANKAAWDKLGQWQKPFLTLYGAGDPILGKADRWLQEQVPGAKGQPHQRMWGGHFVQEDQGPMLAKCTVELIRQT